MRFNSHLNSAVTILRSYNGAEPFHLFIKKYFAADKKYGSRDRKQITSLCYNYFRLGKAVKDISAEERILLGTFLCENKPSAFLEAIKPEWNQQIEKSLEEKFSILYLPAGRQGSPSSIKNIFPYQDELSKGLDADKLNTSFLIQPKLFLRIRPGNEKRVTGKLSGAEIQYEVVSGNCIALSNASKIDPVIELDKEAVVQDYNSQRTGSLLQKFSILNSQFSISIWDCCAASGGKSIMAYDINPKIELTVSDKRESVLQNLHKRFLKAGIKNYSSLVADLTTTNYKLPTTNFDLIICDAPCTGSGTWSRTTEQLFYFNEQSIEKYAKLQKQIVQNIIPFLKPGGYLLYITCSVFKKENEEIVQFIAEKLNLSLKEMKIFKGYEMQADTMFAALFTAPII